MLAPANRRGFLKLLGAAPIAAPVVAKDAAQKIGLEGALGGNIGPHFDGPMGVPDGDHRSWIKKALSRFWSPAQKRQRAESAEWMARRLDPDLASMRSLSPAAAYRIQYERCCGRIDQRARQNLLDQLEESL